MRYLSVIKRKLFKWFLFLREKLTATWNPEKKYFLNDDHPLIKNDVPLNSNFGIDYTVLRDLLASGKWRAANDETNRIVAKIAWLNRRREGGSGRYFGNPNMTHLDRIDTFYFPRSDLHTIDRLWVKFSRGRFGFSVQKRIWLSMGGEIKQAIKSHSLQQYYLGVNFEKKLQQYEVIYDRITFDIKACPGHLPALAELFLGNDNKSNPHIYTEKILSDLQLQYFFHQL